jgi:hypothetical protein
MVRRVREMLGFEGDPGPVPIHMTAFAGDSSVEEVLWS